MTPLQGIGVVLLAVAAAAAGGCGAVHVRRVRLRSEAVGLLGDLLGDSDAAAGEFEAVLAGIRSDGGLGLGEWFGRLIRAAREYGQRLGSVQFRLARIAVTERGLAPSVDEVARQRDRLDALCRTAETADLADPARAAAEVTAAVTGVIQHERGLRAELVSAKRRLEGRAARLAGAERDNLTDPVTRLPNRRAFEDRIAAAAGRPETGSFAVVVFSVDGLSTVNSKLGPAAADAVLAVAARVIRESVRPRGFAARIGTGEFAALLPGADGKSAGVTVEICRRAADAAIVRLGDWNAKFSLSAGVAVSWFGRLSDDVLAEAKTAVSRPMARDRNDAAAATSDQGELAGAR